ncbi:hypothetical protein ACJZ2D_012629 [Fusarium nematophilum]
MASKASELKIPSDASARTDPEKNDVSVSNEMPLYDEIETRRILRKVDFRLVPCLATMYLVAFIDRSNSKGPIAFSPLTGARVDLRTPIVGNAKVAGMNQDLGLSGRQYNIALTVFFIPYVLFEVPSNVVLKLTRPSIWLPSIMLAWGIVLTLTGIVKDFKGLVICRFFLGLAESGFFPGATYLLTIWYCRYEVQTRMVVFFAGASLSGAFSGLLAYAIQHMQGVAGLGGWQWIFILEGVATVLIALPLYHWLPDSPSTAKFLTEDERRFLVSRLEMEAGGEAHAQPSEGNDNDKMSLRHFLDALRDWKIYIAVVIYWGNNVGVYAFSFTIPSVIRELGYSAANAQLLTIPIYVSAMICTVIVAVVSDRVRQRSGFILGGCIVAALGFIALIASPRPGLPGLTYGFLILAASGLYSFIIPTICWIGNNLSPSSKRAVGMATLISVGNLGGIVGSNIFLEEEAPQYWTGYGVCLGIVCMAIASTVVLRKVYQKENAARDTMPETEIREKYTDGQLARLGDRSPYFRYTL